MNEAERRENIRDMVEEEASKGVITCAAAHGIANKGEVSIKKVGEVIEELGIKIKKCQLGCF